MEHIEPQQGPLPDEAAREQPEADVAAGVDAVFLEIHEEPEQAKSDRQNALRLDRLEPLLDRLLRIDAAARA